MRLIAEVKRASPSAGLIREDFDPVEIAKAYEAGGAACITCSPTSHSFKVTWLICRQSAMQWGLPLLRKDFMSTIPIASSPRGRSRLRAIDCRILSPAELKRLHDAAWELGLQTLIELYDEENVDAVLATGTKLVGVNNRDLRTFVTDIRRTLELRKRIPADRLLVGESGITTPEEVRMLGAGGVKAILVGESLMRQSDITQATQTLLSISCCTDFRRQALHLVPPINATLVLANDLACSSAEGLGQPLPGPSGPD